MKKSMINSSHIEGYLYEHKLENKVSGATSKNPGTEFISGTISVATDESLLNVVQIHFTYVVPTFAKSGKPNTTYTTLQAIIDGKIPTVMDAGKESAGRVRVDSSIALNEWYDTRTAGNPLISVKRNEGGFVHQMSAAEDLDTNVENRANFKADMVITKAARVDADEEKGTPEKMILGGCIFDFRNAILPVEFTVLAPKAMDYFESQDISPKNPFFTQVAGNQVSQTVETTTTEESAFGEAMVKTTRSSHRDFVVTWAQAEPYAWDDESTILASELDKAIADREVYLADIKKRQDEYQVTKGNALAGGASAATSPKAGVEYNF